VPRSLTVAAYMDRDRMLCLLDRLYRTALNAKHNQHVRACELLLHYTLGRPAAHTTTGDETAGLTLDALRARAIDLLLTREESRDTMRRLMASDLEAQAVTVQAVPSPDAALPCAALRDAT